MWAGYNNLLGTMPEQAKEPGLFHGWIKNNYVTTMSVAVRRLCDRGDKAVSLIKLLEKMTVAPEKLSRDDWLATRSGLLESAKLQSVWADWGGDIGHHLDPQVTLRDRCRLLEATEDLRRFANKHVAHLDRNRNSFEISVTFGDVDEIVELIHDTYVRYHGFLTGNTLGRFQFPNWKSIFDVAWNPPSEPAVDS
jgi:hypothetical protein